MRGNKVECSKGGHLFNINNMEIKIVKDTISKDELAEMAKEQFGDFVKAVVDIKKEIMAVGGELHADEEALLIEKEESESEYLWGINFYPEKSGEEWIEFDSMVNIKPTHGNSSRGIDSTQIREKILEITQKLVDGVSS